MSILGSLVKKTVDLPKEYLEVHKLALDAMTETQELLETLGQMRDERDALKEEVKALEAKADRQKELVRAEGVYFRLAAGSNGLEQAPYCQACWENDGKLFRISLSPNRGFLCPECYRLKRGAPFPADLVGRMWQAAVGTLVQAATGQ